MKILYVSQYFPPEMGAPAARVAELSRHWTQAGHQVTVLTGFPNHPTGVVPPEYRHALRRLRMREDIHGVTVVRTWLWPLPNRRAHERMLNYGSFCFSAAAAGLSVERPDVVIATSPQLLVGLSGWWVARWKQAPLVFEVRDLWPESLAAVGVDSSHLYRLLGHIADFLYRKSTRTVVVTDAFAKHLVEHRQVPQEKIAVVENGVETELFSPRAATDLRRQLDAEGKFVVCYIGTIGVAHGLGTLVETAARLQTVRPEILFLLVGEGADKARLEELARAGALTNLRFVNQQPRERIPEYICASDACLVLLKKTELFKTVIPSKMLEFMSCARPVVLGVDGQARKVLDAAQAGLFVEPENAADLAQAIVRLAADATLRQTLGRNGRRHILEHFSRGQTARRYLDVLESVVHGERRQHAA